MSRLLAIFWTPGKKPGRPSTVRRFLSETRSDTAVEFAMIGSAFFLFIFGIFVISIDQFWQMTLDDAVRSATRQVEIGLITPTSTPSFSTYVCNEFGVAAPYCTTTLEYSVVGGTSFSGITSGTGHSSAILSTAGLTGPYVATGSSTPNFNGVQQTTPPQPPSVTSPSPPVQGTPQFLLVQVAYKLPFKILAVPGGVATENGTAYLYSVTATAMQPQ